MKSYMRYILSKIAIIVFIPEIIIVRDLNTCKNAPETVRRIRKIYVLS